ncbi:MAG: ATP-dependent helicase, partial [Rothia dentocariosa]
EVVHFPEASEVSAALWRLVWAGLVTNDTFAPVRAMLAGGSSAHPVRPAAPLARPVRRRGAARLSAARTSAGAYPRRYSGLGGTRANSSEPQVSARDSGRFSHISLPQSRPHAGGTESSQEADATVTAYARAELLLDRYGVLTRGALASEDVPGGFAALYRVYAAAEERALVRRGYFIEGLGAAQFASPATVDALRSYANIGADNPQNTGVKRIKNEEVFGLFEGVLLAATDPANPYGAALTWPSVPSLLSASSTPGSTEEAAREGAETAQSVRHRPGRKAGACLILLDGEAVLYLERGGKTLLSFTANPLKLEAAAPLLARIVQAGIAEKIVVEKLNDCDILATPEPPTHRGASKTDSNRLPEHPVVALRRALLAQGFYTTPRGLRMRRSL